MSSIGVNMVVATFVGFGMGYYLDNWLGTSPWFKMAFLFLGIFAGFKNIYVLTLREIRRQEEENNKDSEE